VRPLNQRHSQLRNLRQLLNLHQLLLNLLLNLPLNLSQHNKLSPHQQLQQPQLRVQLPHKQLLSQLQYWQHQVKQLLNHCAELQVVLLRAWKHH
jgi:hypothetical protein